MRRFQRGVHVPMDELREWVVQGRVGPENWNAETSRQFALARTIAAHAACLYADAGFAVAIADVLFPQDVAAHFPDPRCHKVVLWPTRETAHARNATRTNKDFDTATIAPLIDLVCDGMEWQDWTGWIRIDTTRLTLEQTVDALLGETRICP
jgi:hypothetical protein